MTIHTPRRGLPSWAALGQADRDHLASQTPARLQRLMYGTDEGIDPARFAQDVARADEALAQLCAQDDVAAAWFGDLTFAGVAHEPDRIVAAEREYCLCDALIEVGDQRYGGVWSQTYPVFDPSWRTGG